MSEQELDLDIVKRVQQGDKNAFNLLVAKYQNKVAALISRYVANQGDVADVAQEAFIKAYRALPNFGAKAHFIPGCIESRLTVQELLGGARQKPPANDVDAEEAEFYDGADQLRSNASPKIYF